MTPNPNFPANLDIHASTGTHSHLSDHLDTRFGTNAQETAIRQYGIAGRVWEAAYAMTLFIIPPATIEFDLPLVDALRADDRITMVELGSGSGLVASTAARLLKPGRDLFIATDLPEVQEVCSLLESNLASDQKSVIVQPLSWGNPADASRLASLYFTDDDPLRSRKMTHIICSDLVYFPELLAPLLRTLLHLSSPPFTSPSATQQPSLFISYKIRSLAKETAFWSAFGLWFDFQPVLMKNGSEKSHWQRFGSDFDDTTFLFVAHRRHESFDWKVPLSDPDLLGGVGAHGSDTRKGDDTFENLLLMMMED
ncbi:unnamed protein product [Cyclocybe aegerita]|uniref:Methyltransferase-domain-containing protein n=1 Tax=Cyclocybe aegerita TaxID=1973307 RepID=A0A8S0X4M0_CYCAE|nr:unnamed protein product [Cyclocybe aegerita]